MNKEIAQIKETIESKLKEQNFIIYEVEGSHVHSIGFEPEAEILISFGGEVAIKLVNEIIVNKLYLTEEIQETNLFKIGDKDVRIKILKYEDQTLDLVNKLLMPARVLTELKDLKTVYFIQAPDANNLLPCEDNYKGGNQDLHGFIVHYARKEGIDLTSN